MAEFHRLAVEHSGNKTLLLIAEALHHIVEKHHSIVYSDSQAESPEFLRKRAQVGLSIIGRHSCEPAGATGALEAAWHAHWCISRPRV
jgi:DNA-binding FadR family transcriptional regulator